MPLSYLEQQFTDRNDSCSMPQGSRFQGKWSFRPPENIFASTYSRMPQETPSAPQITHIISHNPHGSQQDHLLSKRTETQNECQVQGHVLSEKESVCGLPFQRANPLEYSRKSITKPLCQKAIKGQMPNLHQHQSIWDTLAGMNRTFTKNWDVFPNTLNDSEHSMLSKIQVRKKKKKTHLM